MRDEFIWVEKYRPKTIDDCILPESTKKTFREFLAKGEIPNLLLSGPPGIGKTTVAKALCAELGVDCYVINGSDEGRFLDTVRNQAKNFASTVSLMDADRKHKVIIIDEADNTTHDVQLLLRANIESFYKNCRFIFTCNFKNRIIEPLHSRCAVIDFAITGQHRASIAAQFFKRLVYILELEGVQADKKVPEVRKWCVNNLDNDPSVLLRRVYDALFDTLEGASIAAAVLIIAKYQYQIAFVADQEINLLACMTEIMVECEFK
jgi:DNA polymerase III delta prime subunit